MFYTTSELDKKTESMQCATFLHVAGAQAQEIFDTFTIPEANQNKIETLRELFSDYCEPRKNITVCRYTFNTRQQKNGEKFSEYLTAIKTLAKDCEYKQLEEELLRDRQVCGITDSKVRERMLHMDTLTYKQAVDMCLAAELSALQIKSISLCDEEQTQEIGRAHV